MLCEALKGSAVTSLECAAAPVSAFLSMAIDSPTLSPSPPLARSLGDNNIGYQGATALAAILKETQITNLRCAPPQSVCFCVNAH